MEENKVININDHIEKEESVDETVFDNIMNIFSEIENDDNFGIEEIGALLALPDEQFNILSEIFLQELEKSINNPTDKILLQEAMRQSGKTVEEFAKLQEEVIKEIDKKLSNTLPKNKLDFLKRMMTIITNLFAEAEGTSKTILTIPIELCRENAIMPTYAHDTDAAMDIYCCEDITINPGETVIVPTGIKTAIPKGYALLIQPRSGQSVKTKLRVANTPGLIDSGYRDEIGVIIENIEQPIQDIDYHFYGGDSTTKPQIIIDSILHGKSYTLEKGQRIAQMRLVEAPTVSWMKVDDIGEIEGDRGGGFGSSGK